MFSLFEGVGGLRKSMFCTLNKMLTLRNTPPHRSFTDSTVEYSPSEKLH